MTGDLFDSAPAPIAHYWRQAVDAFRAEGVLGRDAEVAKLAMACAQYQATGRRPRLLILGGPGTGKKLLVEATAAALMLPTLNHHAATLSGTGWQGKSIQDILDHPSARYGRSTLLIHGLEAITVTRGAHGNTVDRVSLEWPRKNGHLVTPLE